MNRHVQKNFFLAFSSIDLNDIESLFYSTAIEYLALILKNEVLKIIERLTLNKTSNSDDIFNKLIKTCSVTLFKLLISLFQVCIDHANHSKVFKTVNTITLKKTSKDDYITLKTYRSMTLLNTLRKVMKSIMSKKLS
jgi:hypothetical protein